MEKVEENKNTEHKTPNLLEYAKSVNDKQNDNKDKNKEENKNNLNIIKENNFNNNSNLEELSENMNEESEKTLDTNDSDNEEALKYFNNSSNEKNIEQNSNKKKNPNTYKEYNYIKTHYLCKIHNKRFIAYCIDCNENICCNCLEMHKEHNISKYNKLILNKNQEKELKYRLYSSYISLKKLKEIILDICSELINLNEIILKNKLKKAYIKYYKQNLYQIEFSKLVYLRYIIQKEISYINYQALVNLYQIKFNNIIFPDSSIEVRERAKIMIAFLAKTENYILLPSDSPHPYINYNPKLLAKIKHDISNKNKSESNKIKNNNNNNNTEKVTKTTENEIKTKDNKTSEETQINNNNDKICKEKSISFIINQTKITTTTNIYLNNSDNDKKSLEKKNEKIIEKNPKKIIENSLYKKEKRYKEIEDQLYYEYLAFIKENPPLNDGVEVQFYKEIKFIYRDKIKNKIVFSIYQGECKKGTQIRHGRGLFKWVDGEKFIGYWVNDKREGKGINCYKNGNLYEGMYKDGKKEGKGRYEWKNGDIYEGEWKNGVKEGEGIYYCSNGDIYRGSFVNDKISGKGVYTWKNEVQYVGEFKNNNINGFGRLYKKIDTSNDDW